MSNEENPMAGWITSREAADVTGYTKEYLRQRARAGTFKAKKMLGRWLFHEESLLEHKRRMDALGKQKYALWKDREAA